MDSVEIDGSYGEGGGQILRTSISLSAILGKPIRIIKIRAGRKEPGLRPQHLQAITSAAALSCGSLRGADIGSTEIEFIPGTPLKEFKYKVNTGTAGSVTLIAQTLIPIAMFRAVALDVEITGGTEVPFSPTIDYLMKIVAPIYRKIGFDVSIKINRRGYFPRGGGSIHIASSSTSSLGPIDLGVERKKIEQVEILSVSRVLPSHVAERQANSAMAKLRNEFPKISSTTDSSGEALSPGSSVLVYSQSEGQFIGASALGERGKKAENVGAEAASKFIDESRSRPSVDSHLADMLATILPCIPGKSSYTTPRVTQHLQTNLEISKKLLAREFEIKEIKGIGSFSVSFL